MIDETVQVRIEYVGGPYDGATEYLFLSRALSFTRVQLCHLTDFFLHTYQSQCYWDQCSDEPLLVEHVAVRFRPEGAKADRRT